MIANWEIGFDAVERILDAVGRKHLPIDINKGGLHAGLVSCLARYHAAVERSSDTVTKDKIARFQKILTPAKRLREQLSLPHNEDTGLRYDDAKYFAELLEDLIDALEFKIDDLNFELRWGPDFDEAVSLRKDPREYADRWKARSPFEWLAGHYLPELFKAHFATRPTFHRRAADGVPESPAIRFVEQALIEFNVTNCGRPYSRESIAKALNDTRTNRFRVKSAHRAQYRSS